MFQELVSRLHNYPIVVLFFLSINNKLFNTHNTKNWQFTSNFASNILKAFANYEKPKFYLTNQYWLWLIQRETTMYVGSEDEDKIT